MDKLMRGVFRVAEVKLRYDDDFIDRLSRRYSVSVFMVFCVMVTTTQYVGNPIKCWCPAHFTDSHKGYTDIVCWVSNTYYVPFEQQIPLDDQPREFISYYQWVPFILVCQALMCYVPAMVWKFMCRRSGLNVSGIIDAVVSGQRTSYADMRDKATRYVVYQVDRYLMARMDRRRKGCWAQFKRLVARYCCLVYGKFYGNYLTISYLFVKLLYLTNAIGQLLLLDIFLGTDFHIYGLDVMLRLFRGVDWTTSYRFPRVTLCNFEIRHQTQVHKYIVQCVLPINLFNEKIFIFIWFWLVGLSTLTAYSFIKWLYKSLFWHTQHSYVKRQLKSLNNYKGEREMLITFTTHYLRRDGIFLIRLISNNVGNLASAEVLNGLWTNYGPDKRYHTSNSRDPEAGGLPPEAPPRTPTAPPPGIVEPPSGLVRRVAERMKSRARMDSV